jgi:antitoxin component YwqK of YwqJK toxin-antitoxin module
MNKTKRKINHRHTIKRSKTDKAISFESKTLDNGFKYEGNFLTIKVQNGQGKMYDTNGVLRYDGEWKNGLENGQGKMYDENGVLKYDGEWKNGMKHGQGICYYDDNGILRYDGEWESGTRNGKGKMFNKNGQLIHDCIWKNDMPIKKV